eukprot:gene12197-336_t
MRAKDVIDAKRSVAENPSAETYKTLLHAHRQLGDTRDGYQAYGDMAAAGITPDLQSYHGMPSLTAESWHWPPAQLSPGDVLALCAAAGRSDEVDKVLADMEAQGYQHDGTVAMEVPLACYNTATASYDSPLNWILKGCAQGGWMLLAIKVFNQLKASQATPPPDAHLHTAFIKVCEKAGDANRAIESLGEMAEAGLVPTAQTINSLITFFQSGVVVPNIASYNALLKACEVTGNPDRASDLYHELQKQEYYQKGFEAGSKMFGMDSDSLDHGLSSAKLSALLGTKRTKRKSKGLRRISPAVDTAVAGQDAPGSHSEPGAEDSGPSGAPEASTTTFGQAKDQFEH